MLDLEEMLKITILCDGNFIFLCVCSGPEKRGIASSTQPAGVAIFLLFHRRYVLTQCTHCNQPYFLIFLFFVFYGEMNVVRFLRRKWIAESDIEARTFLVCE
jgi:hypothetical protein